MKHNSDVPGQLALLAIVPQQISAPVYDPSWDEVVLSPGRLEENGQVSLLYDDVQEPPDPDDYLTIHNYETAWVEWKRRFPDLLVEANAMSDVLEQVTTDTLRASNPDNCVLEQVNTDTIISAPEQNHWIETYPVTRSGNKYWYYRYVWMQGRKLHHVHIPGGNVRSRPARERKQAVEIAIVDGLSPQEIEKLIRLQ